MKEKYVELNSDNIKEWNDDFSNQLTNTIDLKRRYKTDAEYYYNIYILTDNKLSITLKLLENIISQIKYVKREIRFLELYLADTCYNYNCIVDSNIHSTKLSYYEYEYEKATISLKELIEIRNNLIKEYKYYKNEKRCLIEEKKCVNKNLNESLRGVNICDYNINSIHKSLNRLDNVYYTKIDNVPKKYITPKIRKL